MAVNADATPRNVGFINGPPAGGDTPAIVGFPDLTDATKVVSAPRAEPKPAAAYPDLDEAAPASANFLRLSED